MYIAATYPRLQQVSVKWITLKINSPIIILIYPSQVNIRKYRDAYSLTITHFECEIFRSDEPTSRDNRMFILYIYAIFAFKIERILDFFHDLRIPF